MKRTNKLLCLALSGIMVLTLIGTALALKHVDPNECPFCGIGTYVKETASQWIASDHIDTRTCIEHGFPYADWYMRYAYPTCSYCTYSGCERHTRSYGYDYQYEWVCMAKPPVVEAP